MWLFLVFAFLPADRPKARQVRTAFYEAWSGYKKCAFGRDFLRPISCKGADWLNASLTLIDSLDTLWIMGFHGEFDDAVRWLETSFEYASTGSVFELIIRVVGGLMSAYQLSNRQSLLRIAEDFASQLLIAFETPTKLPMPNIDMVQSRPSTWGWAPRSTFLAHAGSLAPELMTLAMHTNNDQIRNASDQIMDFFFRTPNFGGLWPLRIDFSTGLFGDNDLSLDAYGDSFYEYLLKLYALTDKQCTRCGELYREALDGVRKFLLRNTSKGTYIGTIKGNVKEDKLSYLSFFIPGMLALGSKVFEEPRDLELSIALAETAARWHNMTKTGLMGDSYSFNKTEITLNDPSFKLRPEFIESCFYLWRITGQQKWRDIGWRVFEAMTVNCKSNHGYGELKDVNHPELGINDIQDSYLLAETFKYAYLLFSDSNTVSLDEYVFTTEAHPLKKFDQGWLKRNYAGKNGYNIIMKKNRGHRHEDL